MSAGSVSAIYSGECLGTAAGAGEGYGCRTALSVLADVPENAHPQPSIKAVCPTCGDGIRLELRPVTVTHAEVS